MTSASVFLTYENMSTVLTITVCPNKVGAYSDQTSTYAGEDSTHRAHMHTDIYTNTYRYEQIDTNTRTEGT